MKYEIRPAGNRVLITFDVEMMTDAMASSLSAAVAFVAEPYMHRDFGKVQEIILGNLGEIFKVAKYQRRWVYDVRRGVYDVVLN